MNKQLKVFVTQKAQSDISQISDYISIDNKKAALSVVDMFYNSFKLLSNYPETGVVKNDIKDKTVRIYAVKKNFVIVYRIKDNQIEILRILTRYQNIFAIIY